MVAPDFGGISVYSEFHDITNLASFPLDFCSVDEEIEALGNDSQACDSQA